MRTTGIRVFGWLLVTCCCLSLSRAAAPSAAVRPDLVPGAEQFVDRLARGEYAAAAQRFDEAVARALPADKLEQTWQSVVAGAGAFKGRLRSNAVKDQGLDIVVVTCAFEKAAIDVKVVFNKKGEIAGLWFSPSEPPATYQSPAYAAADSFSEQDVVVGEGEWALPGTLTLPKGGGRFPAVVLVHGSGPQDRDETIGPNKPFRDLAEGLATRGIAVLRYEKRTKAHQARMAALLNTITVKEETVDDALAAVARLKGMEKIDPQAIFVLGHSLGGIVIPRIGARAAEVRGFIIMAGAARPFEDVILEQMEYVLSVNGAKPDEAAKALEKVKAQVAKAKEPNLSADTPASDLPLGTPARYWLDLRQVDPAQAIRAVKRPLLILQGGRDYQVTEKDFSLWKQALSDRNDVVLKLYPDLNHLFAEGKGKAVPAEYSRPGHVAKVVIEDVAAWVKKNAEGPRPGG
jgi:dienelactone hydrolase